MSASPDQPAPAADQPQLDFDGRYRVERVDGVWYLCGPAFHEGGKFGMTIPGENKELVEKYRDLVQLLNAVVDAERRR